MSKQLFFMFVCVLLFSACIDEKNSQANQSQLLRAKVIHLKDGDSFVALIQDNEKVEVRLIDIDAPELHQAYGRKAKDYLSKLIKGKTIGIDYDKKDKYGRLLAEVYIEKLFVNEEMIRAGYAWHFDRFFRDEYLHHLEDSARTAGIGLWQDKQPVAPWEWRKQHRRY